MDLNHWEQSIMDRDSPRQTSARLPDAVVEHYIKIHPLPLNANLRDFYQWLNDLADLEGYYISTVNGFAAPGRFLERKKTIHAEDVKLKEEEEEAAAQAVLRPIYEKTEMERKIKEAKATLCPPWLQLHLPSNVSFTENFDPNFRFLTTKELDGYYKDNDSVIVERRSFSDYPKWEPCVDNDTSDKSLLYRVHVTTPWPKL